MNLPTTLKVEIAALWGSVRGSHCTDMSLQSQTQPFSKQRMCLNPVYQVWEGTTVVPNRFCLTSHLEEWKNYNSKKMKLNSRSLEPRGGVQSDYPKGVHSSRSKDLQDGGPPAQNSKEPTRENHQAHIAVQRHLLLQPVQVPILMSDHASDLFPPCISCPPQVSNRNWLNEKKPKQMRKKAKLAFLLFLFPLPFLFVSIQVKLSSREGKGNKRFRSNLQ